VQVHGLELGSSYRFRLRALSESGGAVRESDRAQLPKPLAQLTPTNAPCDHFSSERLERQLPHRAAAGGRPVATGHAAGAVGLGSTGSVGCGARAGRVIVCSNVKP
jgi:hypothetical protein